MESTATTSRHLDGVGLQVLKNDYCQRQQMNPHHLQLLWQQLPSLQPQQHHRLQHHPKRRKIPRHNLRPQQPRLEPNGLAFAARSETALYAA
jgi:hypothetical protein